MPQLTFRHGACPQCSERVAPRHEQCKPRSCVFGPERLFRVLCRRCIGIGIVLRSCPVCVGKCADCPQWRHTFALSLRLSSPPPPGSTPVTATCRRRGRRVLSRLGPRHQLESRYRGAASRGGPAMRSQSRGHAFWIWTGAERTVISCLDIGVLSSRPRRSRTSTRGLRPI